MSKRIPVFLLFLIVTLLTACSFSVDEFLVAPLLTSDQREILAAVQEANAERIMLKYPVFGDWRAPIRFFDSGGHRGGKAVVFYSVAPEINARIAVLVRQDGEWTILGEQQGDGPEVNSAQLLPGHDTNILIEWGSANPGNKRFAVYNFAGQELITGFREECSDILMQDFTEDGIPEFCYVTAVSPDENFWLKYAADDGRGYAIESQIELHPEMVALLSLQTRKNINGRQLVYVDQSIEGSVCATEIFLLENGELSLLEVEKEFDVFRLSMRRSELICRSFSETDTGTVMIPSQTAPRETIADEALWHYWYFIRDGSLNYGFASFVNIPLGLNVGIPENWLEQIVVEEDEEEQRLFRFMDYETGEILLEIKVLRVEEDHQPYEDDGFKGIQRSSGGVYRYLYRAGEGCSIRDEMHIVDNFFGITN